MREIREIFKKYIFFNKKKFKKKINWKKEIQNLKEENDFLKIRIGQVEASEVSFLGVQTQQ